MSIWDKFLEKFNAFVGLSGHEGIDKEASESDLIDYLDAKINNEKIKGMKDDQVTTVTADSDVKVEVKSENSDGFSTAMAELKGSITNLVTNNEANFKQINKNLLELNAKIDGNKQAIEDFKVEVDASNKTLADNLIQEIPKADGVKVQEDVKPSWNKDLDSAIERFTVSTVKK